MADEDTDMETRLIPLPGVPLRRSLSQWLDIPPDSPLRAEYDERLREVDRAERAAYQAAQGVIVL